MDEKGIKKIFDIKDDRTLRQNRAVHVAFGLLAESLSDAGLDQRKVLKPSVEIPWTPQAVKEQLYRPIMKAMFNFKSTTELDTKQISDVWEVLTRELSKNCGEAAAIPFPSQEQTDEYLKSFKKL